MSDDHTTRWCFAPRCELARTGVAFLAMRIGCLGLLLAGTLAAVSTRWCVQGDSSAQDSSRQDVRGGHVASRGESPHDACRQTAAWIQRQLGDGCCAVVRAPLVLAGDLSAEELESWHRRVIAPAARAMTDQYFAAQPTEPVTILLISSEQRYRRCAEQLFGDKDVSRFGYYRPHLRVLVVNLEAGNGGLLHELTHALAAFDFPDMPDWLGEGLASLHEDGRVREDGSGIEAAINWRLPVLQQAIRKNRLPPLESLVCDDGFRRGNQQLNYAHARYFCLYMQDRGVLADVYRRMRADCRTDPSGGTAVRAALGGNSWQEIDAAFRRFVMDLPTR